MTVTWLTKRAIEGIVVEEGERDFYDTELKGFGVRVRASGRKTYFVMMRHNCRLRRFTIGLHGPYTSEFARIKAKAIIAKLAAGEDPNSGKGSIRNSITVRSLCERFLDEYVPVHLKLNTQREYKRSVKLFILPEIGSARVISIQRPDVAALHHRMRHIPYQANRTLGVLSVIFSQAEMWNLRDQNSNPCHGVKRFKEAQRERFLSTEERQRLGAALEIEQYE